MPELRKLGGSGLSIAPLVVGGNVFGWTVDQAESFEILDAFVDGGVTMIDTADSYYAFAPGNVGGESETIIGNWMQSRANRDRVQIATKVGLLPGRKGLAAGTICKAVEESLLRLRTDYIDLYFAHTDDDSVPQLEVAEAFDRLVRSGKVRAIGASNFSRRRLSSALSAARENGLAQYTALQPQLNLMSTESFSPEARALCMENDIGVITYFALASGFLTGKYRDVRDVEGTARAARLEGYFNDRGRAVLAALAQISAEAGASHAQIALAWVMAQPRVTAPIASATSVDQAKALLPAMELELHADALKLLDQAAAIPI